MDTVEPEYLSLVSQKFHVVQESEMRIIKPDNEFENIELKPFGRRPTTINDIKGILTLIKQSRGNFLEVGAWWGKTTYELATRFPERTFHTIDFLEIQLPYECAMTTRAPKEDLCKYARHLPNVAFHYIESSKFDYKGKGIGIVFIDGNHSEDGCRLDTELAIRNLPRGGIICWHDSFQSRFGVKSYLEREIDRKYERTAFEKSQITFIRI